MKKLTIAVLALVVCGCSGRRAIPIATNSDLGWCQRGARVCFYGEVSDLKEPIQDISVQVVAKLAGDIGLPRVVLVVCKGLKPGAAGQKRTVYGTVIFWKRPAGEYDPDIVILEDCSW